MGIVNLGEQLLHQDGKNTRGGIRMTISKRSRYLIKKAARKAVRFTLQIVGATVIVACLYLWYNWLFDFIIGRIS